MSGRDFVRSLPGGGLPAVRRLNNMHLDPLLLAALLGVIAFGLVVLFSALGKDIAIFDGQVIRILLALAIMVVAAQFEPGVYLRWTPLLYAVGMVMLVAVEFFGVIVKGSQRWLEVPGLPRFQPSEIMRIAVPLMVAWYFNERPLPPRFGHLVVALCDHRRAGCVDRDTAGPRHRNSGGGGRTRSDRAGRIAMALDRARGARRRRGRAGPVVCDARLSARPGADAVRSGTRSARRRLEHHSVHHRDRLGRRVRQRAVRRYAVAPRFPAGRPDRLHHRGGRRGTRD